jgi:hypothetical protein
VPDLHGWITQQITEREQLANLISAGGYEPDEWRAEPSRSGRWTQIVAYSRTIGEPPEAATRDDEQAVALVQTGRNEHLLIVLNDPAAVLRRCAADRKILARHNVDPDKADDWIDATSCMGCGTYGEMGHAVTDNLNECPELLDLAEGYGLTEEQRAGLDRPEPERPESRPGFLIPESFNAGLLQAFLATRPVEPSPEEKAVQILEPELKKIGIYVPGADQST